MQEQERLRENKAGKIKWKQWGPYVTDRQWGTVREDYSENGQPWDYVTHDMARSKTYRWGEEGIAGICDKQQLLCLALAVWNKKDPIIKERYFGLNNPEGNHGEDVKELYYYLDSTPTHSYMKMLYKYPQQQFPYAWLVEENKKRSRLEAEFELIDTGIFNDDKYFDIFVEYAKADAEDILVKVTVHNRATEDAAINIMPTIWFRNTWAWGYDAYKPDLRVSEDGGISIDHKTLGPLMLHLQKKTEILFCDNESNDQKLYSTVNAGAYCKDGINEYLTSGNKHAINPEQTGTKAAANYDLVIKAGSSQTIKLRLGGNTLANPFGDFDDIFQKRTREADEFYGELQKEISSADEKSIQRQAWGGMLWNKQFYYYDVYEWLKGDPSQPALSEQRRKHGRNSNWTHLNNYDIISMPDKWEYPWFAAWDLAFHCLPFAMIDPGFAKKQLELLTKEWYMHPNGHLPAYEWSFSDANPPVHAWASWRVYKIDQKHNNGEGDIQFLESVFHKLIINFTWWVNRKDDNGNNIFQGGFLGLDNIGVFDRNAALPKGGHLEQADGTSWMAMYSLNLMRIALELSKFNPVYQDMASKFFEHFLLIAGAMADIGKKGIGLWDEEDQFFYDVLKHPHEDGTKLKVRSLVGLSPLFAVEVIDHEILQALPEFTKRLRWFLEYRPDLASMVSRWEEKSPGEKHLLSLLRGHRMKKILCRMLDEKEFLSEFGIRSLSKYHEKHPYDFWMGTDRLSVQYTPAESVDSMFGGNSNWRGPIWAPANFLLIESLQRFHYYYGDDFKVECPTGSGVFMTLKEVSEELTMRFSRLFRLDENGHRTYLGSNSKMQDVNFKDHLLFYEYFNGDTGEGLGAAHQTGWTGLIAKLLLPKH